jgi:hypothetical protein
MYVENTLLALNAGNCGPRIVDFGHNLSFPDTTCPAGFLAGNPGIGPLQDNGGPAQTLALVPGSAAIDQVPTTGSQCPATDERGVKRPSGAACDIGAYEAAPPAVSTGRATATGFTAATVTATVTPNSTDASVTFEYGRTTAYGKTTAVQHLGGVSATAASARLVGLKPGGVYHYRIVASSVDGQTTGADRTFTAKAILAALKITPRSFRATGRHAGATVTYSDSDSARTMFTVKVCTRHARRRCARFATLGRFSHRDRAGSNRVHLTGRIHGRVLSPRTYRLTATPTDGHVKGRTITTTFTIRRAGRLRS